MRLNMRGSVTWQGGGMAREHSSIDSVSSMKDNLKKTRCMDMVVRYNQMDHTMLANGTTTIGKAEVISNLRTAQSMRANGEITKSTEWAK